MAENAVRAILTAAIEATKTNNPTEDMIEAGQRLYVEYAGVLTEESLVAEIYRAMEQARIRGET